MADRTAEAHGAIDAVWRIESARLIASLARIVRDVGLAEELASDALVAALEQWPRSGVPENPGAWLMATAKHRAIDLIRRQVTLERKYEQLGRMVEREQQLAESDVDAELDNPVKDDLLALVFMTCHPILSTEARVALTLRLIGALSTDEIARAFLVSKATVAQRVVRAKRTLAEAPCRSSCRARRASRAALLRARRHLPGVQRGLLRDRRRRLGATGAVRGRPAARPDPRGAGADRARGPRAGRPDGDPGVAAARALGPSGEPILLLDQDRSRWDGVLVQRGLAAVARRDGRRDPRPYALQASIAACHARARTAGDTDWERITALYDALAVIAPSPVVELNRAVAVSMAFGPEAGLELVDALVGGGALSGYHLLPSVRADLLLRLGRSDEARAELTRAAALTHNERERAMLLERAAAKDR